MPPHTLFLTGHLAEKRLRSVLAAMEGLQFSWAVQDIGIQVAALMTTDLIRRRLPKEAVGVERVMVPGHCRGDLGELSRELGITFERGPEDLHDLPVHFGRSAGPVDLTQYSVRIFAEIVDAPTLPVDAIIDCARRYIADGADVIDLGCLPATPFPHMEEAIAAIKELGLSVSIDSANLDELRRGGRAGADFVLSLSEASLDLVEDIAATPIVIPAHHGDLDSLRRAAERLERLGRPFIADPILDPVPFGFTASLLRYAELRRRLPEAPILMGIGNVTELTDADTTGLNALLFGVIAELDISAVLAVQKSPHCRTTIREADRARRLMHAARRLQRLPVGMDQGLMALRDRRPFTSTSEEIAELATQIRDPNFRIEAADDGIHVYNRDGHWVARNAFDFFPWLDVENDGAHAFYLGVELGRAQTAWELGKRYVQDEDLRWGVAVGRRRPAPGVHHTPGPTRQSRAKRREDSE